MFHSLIAHVEGHVVLGDGPQIVPRRLAFFLHAPQLIRKLVEINLVRQREKMCSSGLDLLINPLPLNIAIY